MKLDTIKALPYTRILFEEGALDYPIGNNIYQSVRQTGREIGFLKSHNRVTQIPGSEPREAFFNAKNTLVVGVRKGLDFASCKPSAHFQIPLVTGCPAICEYCYLNTNMGKKPYTRVYVNVDEILGEALRRIEERKPQITVFEAAATSDPVPVENLSRALSQTIDFFAGQEYGRLRIATKFPCPAPLLSSNHGQHTRIRYTLNCERIIKSSERRTPALPVRFAALREVLESGYPAGVIIAPVFLEGEWQREYEELLTRLRDELSGHQDIDLHFEVISHRFTTRARTVINQVFPESVIPMDEKTGRSFKYGQFGYGKYLYEPKHLNEMKVFFQSLIPGMFPKAVLEYII